MSNEKIMVASTDTTITKDDINLTKFITAIKTSEKADDNKYKLIFASKAFADEKGHRITDKYITKEATTSAIAKAKGAAATEAVNTVKNNIASLQFGDGTDSIFTIYDADTPDKIISLSSVAKSGSYTDLSNKPIIFVDIDALKINLIKDKWVGCSAIDDKTLTEIQSDTNIPVIQYKNSYYMHTQTGVDSLGHKTFYFNSIESYTNKFILLDIHNKQIIFRSYSYPHFSSKNITVFSTSNLQSDFYEGNNARVIFSDGLVVGGSNETSRENVPGIAVKSISGIGSIDGNESEDNITRDSKNFGIGNLYLNRPINDLKFDVIINSSEPGQDIYTKFSDYFYASDKNKQSSIYSKANVSSNSIFGLSEYAAVRADAVLRMIAETRANKTKFGGIKLKNDDFTLSDASVGTNKKYPVQLSVGGIAYVDVPWSNSTDFIPSTDFNKFYLKETAAKEIPVLVNSNISTVAGNKNIPLIPDKYLKNNISIIEVNGALSTISGTPSGFSVYATLNTSGLNRDLKDGDIALLHLNSDTIASIYNKYAFNKTTYLSIALTNKLENPVDPLNGAGVSPSYMCGFQLILKDDINDPYRNIGLPFKDLSQEWFFVKVFYGDGNLPKVANINYLPKGSNVALGTRYFVNDTKKVYFAYTKSGSTINWQQEMNPRKLIILDNLPSQLGYDLPQPEIKFDGSNYYLNNYNNEKVLSIQKKYNKIADLKLQILYENSNNELENIYSVIIKNNIISKNSLLQQLWIDTNSKTAISGTTKAKDLQLKGSNLLSADKQRLFNKNGRINLSDIINGNNLFINKYDKNNTNIKCRFILTPKTSSTYRAILGNSNVSDTVLHMEINSDKNGFDAIEIF